MPSRGKSLSVNAALAAAVLTGLVAVAAANGVLGSKKPSQPPLLERQSPKIQVKGKVKGLYPGSTRTMKVKVANRSRQKVRLVSIRARRQAASAACSKKNVKAKRFKGRTRLPARSKVKVPLIVRMKPTAPDACQGALFPITFRARLTGQRP